MSLFDKPIPMIARTLAMLLSMLVLSACQVRPLYETGMADALSSVSVSESETAIEQSVRNELVFLFYGGSAKPATPRYDLDLAVTSSTEDVVYDATLNSTIAGRVTVTAAYKLVDTTNDTVLIKTSKSVTSQIDDLHQEFARIRAIRDGEKRAARELAEFIRADVAGTIARQAR